MTSAPKVASPARRLALLATLASSLLVAACGGGGGSGNGSSSLRTINLTTDLASVDLYTGDTRQFTAVTTDTLTSTVTLDAATYTFNLKNVGDAAALFTGSYSLSKDQSYTAVVWGRQSALRVSTLGESEDPAGLDAANTRIRAFNATLDSGPVDVYITAADVDLGSVTANQSGLASSALGSFREFTAKNYRIRVTGAGNIDDVRLDIPDVTLAAKTFYTLVITQSGTGGVLLNGTLIAQGGARTTVKNLNARVRVAASVANFGVVSAKAGTKTLVTGWRSPRAPVSGADYVLVPAGSTQFAVQVNGTLTAPLSKTLDAGSDYTLLVNGTAAAPALALLNDDNRLPNVAARAKVRVVNGLTGTAVLTGEITTFPTARTGDASPGAASDYTVAAAVGSTKIEVFSSEAFDPIYSISATISGQNLLAQLGVHTIFILDGQTAPVGKLVQDR